MTTAIVGSIDRTSLSLSALTIGQGNGLSFFVGGVNVGRRVWRRMTESSPWVAGEVETAAVLDQSRDPQYDFRARASSESALKTLVASLVTAVEQPTWDLTITVGGTAWPTLTCTRADTLVAFDVAHARGLTARVSVFTTHNPTSAGPI